MRAMTKRKNTLRPMVDKRNRTFPARAREAVSGGRCRFCRRGEKYVDYKDIDTLQRLLTNRGKIYSRKRSGNCAGCQRKAKKAIKRARYMALLPYAT
jgi:small subunit ribosomal protein S18